MRRFCIATRLGNFVIPAGLSVRQISSVLWLVSRTARNFLSDSKLSELGNQDVEKLRWQDAIVDAAFASSNRSQVEPRPGEDIDLIEDDPRAIVIKAEVLLHPKWNFDGHTWIVRCRVRDRDNGHLLATGQRGIRMVDRENDRAGTIFSPLDLPSFLFFFPEIGIRNDETGFGFRKAGHGYSRFRLLAILRPEAR